MTTIAKSSRTRTCLIIGISFTLALGSCTSPRTHKPLPHGPEGAPTGQIAAVCDNTVPGPTQPPENAIVVDPSLDQNLNAKTQRHPAGTTFWLAPGTHSLGTGKFAQIIPKDGNTYLGAPGAVLDGQGANMFAFTQHAENVTIKYLTIENFVAPNNQGVVNHDSGNGWVIAHNTIQNNKGAAMMAGAHQVVRGNCIRNNGQYGINAYQAGNRVTDLTIIGNEIVGNNTDNWEARIEGCGCTGGMKLWSVNGATIQGNWIHGNHGAGIWADMNNNDILIERNIIENNDSEAIFYEASYNAIIRNNVIRGNTWVAGKTFTKAGDEFPVAAIYISESGEEPRIPARTNKIEIYGNVLMNNWSGITLWENADRFCNSPANPTNDCTLLVANRERCSQPQIESPPLFHDCRWKTQRVDIHDNFFSFDPQVVDCTSVNCGRMAILSNYGSFPDWSPYHGRVIQKAITFHQDNWWHDNAYVGPWSFVAYETTRALHAKNWQSEPYRQDRGSTFSLETDR